MERYPTSGAVIVTGAAQGIGRRMALSLVAEGVDVCIADWNEQKGHWVATNRPPAAAAASLSRQISPAKQVRSCDAFEAIQAFSSVFGLINNASIFSTLKSGPSGRFLREEWDPVQKVNLTGVFNMARAAREALVDTGHGSIVTFHCQPYFSDAELRALRLVEGRCDGALAGYGAGTRAFWRAGEYAHSRTDLHRSRTRNSHARAEGGDDRHPMPAAAKAAEDIADAALFLLSKQARWVTGQLLNVDGGMMTH